MLTLRDRIKTLKVIRYDDQVQAQEIQKSNDSGFARDAHQKTENITICPQKIRKIKHFKKVRTLI